MADKSNIEWTDATWNPIVGCSIVSPGCTNCYAMKMAARIQKMNRTGGSGSNYVNHYDGTTQDSKAGAVWTGKVALAPDKLFLKPISWRQPRRVFVNSMGDLFHESISDEWIDRVFAVMALCPQHTFQVLTKRAERMRVYLSHQAVERIYAAACRNDETLADRWRWPLPNIWLGVSCERQQEADERIPLLLQTPAAVRFISAEPLLGQIDLTRLMLKTGDTINAVHQSIGKPRDDGNGYIDFPRVPATSLNWVIVGGESGPGARPFHLEWADDLVGQCRGADVACFVKQFGAVPMSDGYPLELKSSKGGDWDEWPERLRVRQFPTSRSSRITSGEHQKPNAEMVRP